ncbi:hypothetical protein CW368_01180 [Actinomycetales bacterium SN12]|nr:hypothetical protein CW368_01180 [Actinomycetales bacterium SN12]
MTDYSVTPPLVQTLGSALDGSASSIHSSLSALSARAGALAGQWRGDAADAYQARQADWSQEMAAHARALQAAAEAARTAAEVYADADERVGRLWSIG